MKIRRDYVMIGCIVLLAIQCMFYAISASKWNDRYWTYRCNNEHRMGTVTEECR